MENKKRKTPEQSARERLRKRTRSLITKIVSFEQDLGFHVQVLLIDKEHPEIQFEFKTFDDPNYPPHNPVK
jgi:hypothetical protein